MLILFALNPCFAKGKAEKNKTNVVVAQNKGKELRITVPAPRTKGLTEADDWAAQVVQDLMTQGLCEYTEMTVIDRANESLVIEEQKRSERGEYSDSDYLEMGKITQAQYLLVGSIVHRTRQRMCRVEEVDYGGAQNRQDLCKADKKAV